MIELAAAGNPGGKTQKVICQNLSGNKTSK